MSLDQFSPSNQIMLNDITRQSHFNLHGVVGDEDLAHTAVNIIPQLIDELPFGEPFCTHKFTMVRDAEKHYSLRLLAVFCHYGIDHVNDYVRWSDEEEWLELSIHQQLFYLAQLVAPPCRLEKIFAGIQLKKYKVVPYLEEVVWLMD